MLVLLLCAAGRLGFFLAVHPWDRQVQREVVLASDSVGYHELAVGLVEDGRYDSGELGSLRTPVYPGLIAGVYAVFGNRPWVVLLVQIAMDTAACLLLMLMVGRMLSKGAAVGAGLLYAISPFLIIHCSRLLSEILFVFLCTLALYFVSRAMRPEKPGRSLVTFLIVGIILGAAALTKPVAVCLLILLIFALLVRRLRKPVDFLAQAAVVTVAFAVVVSPWCWRNHDVYGRYGISTSADYNLLVLHVGGMEVARTGKEHKEVKQTLLAEADAMIVADGRDPATMNSFNKAAYWKRLAKSRIRSRFGEFTKATAIGVVHSFANLGTGVVGDMLQLSGRDAVFDFNAHPNIVEAMTEWFRVKSAAQIIAGAVVAVLLLVIYLSLLFGLFVAWRGSTRAFLLLCILGTIYFVIVAGPAGLARFRLPAVPFYLPFAGAGLAWAVGKSKKTAHA